MDAVDLVTQYIASGIEVFPLFGVVNGACACARDCGRDAGKHPLLGLAHRKDDPARRTCRGECGRLGHGLHDATAEPGQVAEWLARYPTANWAIRVPRGVLVLDVDPRNGGDVELAKLEEQHGKLPATLTARTGSGGLHIWLSYSGPTRGKLCAGVDVKTNSGYVVAPPSLHIALARYEWIDQRPAAYAPQWVKARMNPPIRRRPLGEKRGNIDPLVEFVAKAAEGTRNDRLYWAACRAYDANLDPEPLIDAAVSVGTPANEARATVASAANRGPRSEDRRPTAAECMSRKATAR